MSNCFFFLTFYDLLKLSGKECYCRLGVVVVFFLTLFLSALCPYMLAKFESECDIAETLTNWHGTETSIEGVGGGTSSGVFPL